MGFSGKQLSALQRKLDGAYVRNREFQGRTLSYIEGWHAIAEANRIFGFDSWDRETVETRCVLDRDDSGSFHAVYVAKVRITVRADGMTVLREGYGTGEAHGTSAGATHEKALKTAETDATKRALATFGKPFGLSLYVSPRNGRDRSINGPDRGISNPLPGAPPIPDHARRRTQQRIGRNGRYYVPPRAPVVLDPALSNPPLDQNGPTQATGDHVPQAGVPWLSDEASVSPQNAGDATALESAASQIGSPPLQPPAQTTPSGDAKLPGQAAPSDGGIPSDQSTPLNSEPARLLIDWPKRRREPEHLKYVRTQPCLICSRTPSDAHHLRFAQPHGIGHKVSDEFTVPLCRVHHDQLHHSGKEIDWWSAMDRDVDPLMIARTLWEESRAKVAAGEPQVDSSLPSHVPSK